MRARLAIAALAALLLVSRGGVAAADERLHGDDTYGRIEGDLSILAGAGVIFGPRAPRIATELRARYLGSVGVFAGYEDGLGVWSSRPRRVVPLGLEARPVFLGRWLLGKELGVAFVDLLLDSIGVDLGVFFAQPDGGSFASRPGFSAGLGAEVPVFARASGLHLTLRGGVAGRTSPSRGRRRAPRTARSTARWGSPGRSSSSATWSTRAIAAIRDGRAGSTPRQSIRVSAVSTSLRTSPSSNATSANLRANVGATATVPAP